VLCWDYFFTRPYYSLELADPRDVFALVAFLIVALVVSAMTEQIRRQNENLSTLAQSIAASYNLSQMLSRLASAEEIASYAASQIADLFACRAVVVLMDQGGTPSIFPSGGEMAPEDLEAAAAVFAFRPVASSAADARRSDFIFLPLKGSHGRLGAVGVSRRSQWQFSNEERQRLDAFLSQTAFAIERARLTRDVEHSKMIAETERMRSALLTSVSHDLRTPLTTIIGALSTLATSGSDFSPEVHAELVATAHDEAERLDRFVGNLLDITRLESGSLAVRTVPVDIAEVVESALERAHELLSRHELDVELPPGLPDVEADFALLEQVLFNVLDNAAKYSPAGTVIAIRLAALEDAVMLRVADEGPGIPDEALERIFEKFTRFDRADSVTPGTGLGLMICRGFMSVMGGTIIAGNRTDGRGAVFSIRVARCRP
jgi:two-component system sensor histidine kinase KdpD